MRKSKPRPTTKTPAPASAPRASRKFRVARLPHQLRAQVEEMLRDGQPYTKIIGHVRAHGHTITKSALSSWWNLHERSGRELGAARHVAGVAEAVAKKLLAPKSDLLPVLRELLAAELYRRRGELLQLPVQDLIFELRQLERLKPSAPKLSAEELADALAARLAPTEETTSEEKN